MPLTIQELKERMAKQCDEITLLELLEIDATDIVEKFLDRIENRYDQLALEFDEEDSEEEIN